MAGRAPRALCLGAGGMVGDRTIATILRVCWPGQEWPLRSPGVRTTEYGEYGAVDLEGAVLPSRSEEDEAFGGRGAVSVTGLFRRGCRMRDNNA
mgnify:CR=1 FL=1